MAAAVGAIAAVGWIGITAAAAPGQSVLDRGLLAESIRADEPGGVLPDYLTRPFAKALWAAGPSIDEGGYPTRARVLTPKDVAPAEAGNDDDGAPWDTPLRPDDPHYDLAAELNLLAQWWRPAEVWAEGPPLREESDLAAQLAEAGITVTAEGWVHPLPNGKFVSSFGPRAAIPGVIGAVFHNGVDLAAPLGYPIRAAADGTVTYVGNGNRQLGLTGWVVVVDHGDGVETSYNHMARAGVLVSVGDSVGAGQIIALVGSEGRSSGPHLHFGVHVDAASVDPAVFMLSRGIDLRSGRTVTPVPLTSDWLAAQERYRRQAQDTRAATAGSVPGGPSASPSATEPAEPGPSEPAPSPSESESESGEPTPEPSPSEPTPTPEPTPDPSPSESSPSPEPTPTPAPTPAPSPEPEPSGSQGAWDDPSPSFSATLPPVGTSTP